MGKTRDTYWDSLKFVLIFLVVLGHMIEPYITSSKVILAVYNFIYLFHMPLFVFVSGRFSVMKERPTGTAFRINLCRSWPMSRRCPTHTHRLPKIYSTYLQHI